jgi:drug/metabolite transporter (DMT)-like permease
VAASFLRFVVASTFLLLIIYKNNGRMPPLPRRLWLPTSLLGLTGVFVYNILFLAGLKLVPAGRASIIIANNPVMIALGAVLIFGHRLGPIKFMGVLISVAGAITAISRGHLVDLFSSGIGLGDLMIFGCVLSWACFSLIGKTVLSQIPPLTAVAYASVIGSLLLLTPAIMSGMFSDLGTYALLDWINIFYLGFFGTVLGFVWYYQGIEKIGPTRAALYINFVPISAIIMAYLILKEPVTWSLAAGVALVIIGVYLTNNGLSLPGQMRNQS